jgi:hypothetical protein
MICLSKFDHNHQQPSQVVFQVETATNTGPIYWMMACRYWIGDEEAASFMFIVVVVAHPRLKLHTPSPPSLRCFKEFRQLDVLGHPPDPLTITYDCVSDCGPSQLQRRLCVYPLA